MNTATRISAAVVGLAAAATMTACGTDTQQSRTPTVTATVTESSAAPTAAPTDTDDTPATDIDDAAGTASGGNAPQPQPQPQAPAEPCGPRNLSPATINAAMSTIRTDGPGYSWTPGASNFSTCNDISYVELDTARGTGSSPWQLMIFDRAGTFLGTGIKCNASYQHVVSSSSDRITVRYDYIRGDEPLAAPSGRAQVTFRWNGSRVVMDGTLPYGVTYGKC